MVRQPRSWQLNLGALFLPVLGSDDSRFSIILYRTDKHMDKSSPQRLSKYYSSQQLQAQDISGDCNMLWSQRIKLKYQHPSIHLHQGILKGKKMFNIVRNSTEIKHRVTHLQELRVRALAIGTAGQRGTTIPLALPCVQSSVNPHPIFFSPALQAKCRVDRF